MMREEWITALHGKLALGNRPTPERAVAMLAPRLADLPDEWFTEEAIDALFLKLRSLNSPERVRKELRDFHPARPSAAQSAPRWTPEPETDWEQRGAVLRQDWDDPVGIRDKVNRHQHDHWAMRRLALLVANWAPQHLAMLPPAILSTVAANSWQFAGLLKRIDMAEFVPPQRTAREQIETIAATPEPQPHYLTPKQLDQINPLPGGRKRVTA
jgi:hypothetical protein